ncbi:PilW family protein [Ectopseudomonas guguanensis]|uniref:Type IV pilus assembly protein PilW n=1 Tax=Ectopseudomonas guguanensis TaxID=1198456 RepID=A0A1H0MI87_9GAMM|nr:PilW family protein [Pseudomonas guguanensis]SDO80071.1 type IV pilus assembly protein PilW [Pseudomonas guguanensis]
MISTFPKRQAGLSLVELMIAITLSLLLIAGVLQIFLSSKQTYSTNNALSRVQESGRFAMDFLTQDIRNTGYKGQCLGQPLTHGTIDILWRLDNPIEGWNNVSGKQPTHLTDTPVTDTDTIRIKLAAGPVEVQAASGNTATNNTISLGTNPSGIARHAITLISDAINCDLFQNTATSNATSVAKAAGVNWTHNYTGITEVLPLQNATYYIRANAGRPNSLVRQRLSASTTAPEWVTEELVDGVQDMQILYGIAGANRQVTDYVTANNVTNWDNVVAVRINLLVVSADTNVVPENQVIAFNGADVTIANRRLAQVFSTTIGIRNRLP